MPKFSTAARQAFPDFASNFDEIENQATAWAQRFRDAEASVERGLVRAEERRQNNVELLIGITAAGIALRTQHLAAATVTLVNKDNPHAAAPVARALFEVCCMPIYLKRELVPRVRKGRANTVHKLVFKMGLGGIGPASVRG